LLNQAKKLLQAFLSGLSLFLISNPAFAMAEGMEEAIADKMVWLIIIVMPIAFIYGYWKIHILPEKYAEKVHHPHLKTIKVLCFLSIVFGGLFWPLAWLLAYSKPVFYKMAYGTDKSDEYFTSHAVEHAGAPLDLSMVEDEIMQLEEKLSGLNQKRDLIKQLRSSAQSLTSKGENHA
jgi:CBS domain containing-hemolysin-like protein